MLIEPKNEPQQTTGSTGSNAPVKTSQQNQEEKKPVFKDWASI